MGLRSRRPGLARRRGSRRRVQVNVALVRHHGSLGHLALLVQDRHVHGERRLLVLLGLGWHSVGAGPRAALEIRKGGQRHEHGGHKAHEDSQDEGPIGRSHNVRGPPGADEHQVRLRERHERACRRAGGAGLHHSHDHALRRVLRVGKHVRAGLAEGEGKDGHVGSGAHVLGQLAEGAKVERRVGVQQTVLDVHGVRLAAGRNLPGHRVAPAQAGDGLLHGGRLGGRLQRAQATARVEVRAHNRIVDGRAGRGGCRRSESSPALRCLGPRQPCGLPAGELLLVFVPGKPEHAAGARARGCARLCGSLGGGRV
mmetsp:Transcript_3858/g.15942  ORF Transcript_3858/g.15942 Transcript_3858/m.15942 type:complete len:312 (-) Transcript_3858:3237-4172(-)